ncbi:MAG: HAD family phosphatase [Methylococcales bacterium]|nr:HAD family phosphatase [Methylococcales bacterium]
MTQKIPPFSALIFDLDGLVLDTERTYLLAWQQAAKAMGYQLDEPFCLSLSGLAGNQAYQRLADYWGREFDLKCFQTLSGEYWYAHVKQNGIDKKAGLSTLLKIIKKQAIPYCIATNSPEFNARECLTFAGLDGVFTTIIARDHVNRGKPAPDLFLKAADSLQQPINQCLVLEDSLIGIQAAYDAGASPLLIPSQTLLAKDLLIHSDIIFDNLTQVSKIILANLPKNKSLTV